MDLHTIPVELRTSPTIRSCFGYLRGRLDKLNEEITAASSSAVFAISKPEEAIGMGEKGRETVKPIMQVFGTSPPFMYLLTSAEFASTWGFNQGDRLFLEPVTNDIVPSESVSLEPLTIEDWLLVEASTSQLEDVFLEQIRIIHTGCVITLYVSTNAVLHLRVGKLFPG